MSWLYPSKPVQRSTHRLISSQIARRSSGYAGLDTQARVASCGFIYFIFMDLSAASHEKEMTRWLKVLICTYCQGKANEDGHCMLSKIIAYKKSPTLSFSSRQISGRGCLGSWFHSIRAYEYVCTNPLPRLHMLLMHDVALPLDLVEIPW